MRFDPADSRTSYFSWFRLPNFTIHEDSVGNPLHLIASLTAAVAVWRRREAFEPPVRSWAWLTAATALAFCVGIKWQIWNSRLHLPLFVLATPLIGVCLGRRRRLAFFWATAFCVLALPSLVAIQPRPLVGRRSVVATPRMAQVFRNEPQIQPVYEAAVELLGEMRCQRVGLVLGGNDWEYPFWPLLRVRFGTDLRIWHVLVTNASARVAAPEFGLPCALLVVGRESDGGLVWEGRRFIERWRWAPVRVYALEPDG
jgi:hypothetical protein